MILTTPGLKYMHHPEVGDLELNFEVHTPPEDSGHRILMYTAAPGSPAAEALQLLQDAIGAQRLANPLAAELAS
jgi:hypothetical protein